MKSGEYNWFTPGDFKTPKILTDSKRKITDYAAKNNAVIYQPNTILITCIGDIGNAGIIKKESSANQQITGIVVDTDIIDPEFFLYWVKANKLRIQDEANQAVVPIINNKGLKRIKVTFPSDIPTQNKIVSLLDKASALVQKREESITLLDELLRAQFMEMFGESSQNLKSWTINKLGDHIQVLTDYHANGSYKILNEQVTLKNEKDYALMVRTTDLEKNDFENDVNYITKNAYDFLKKTPVYGGEIIINKIGSAGKVYLMPYLDRPVSLGMNAFMLRFEDTLNNLYAYYYLTSDYGEWQLKKRVKGAVTKTIRKDAVRDIPIPIPPIKLQNQFEIIYHNIQAQKERLTQSKTELEHLYNSLLQRAFRGQLNFNIDIELDVLLAAIDIEQDTDKEKHDIKEIATVYAGRLLERIEEQKFDNQTQYQQAKQVVFQMLEEGIVEQAYDEKTESVKLKLV